MGPRNDLNPKLFSFYFYFLIQIEWLLLLFTDTFSISILTNFQSPASTLEGAAMVATKITSAGHTRIIPSCKERGRGIRTKWWNVERWWRIALDHSAAVTYAPFPRRRSSYLHSNNRGLCLRPKSTFLPLNTIAHLSTRTSSLPTHPIERIHHWYSLPRHQRLLWCRSSSATVLLRLPRSESECMPIAKEPHHAGSRGQTSHMQLESRPSPRFKISSGQFSFWPKQCIATRL